MNKLELMKKYYNPHPMLSHRAPLTIMVGARGTGKTYAMKLKALTRDYETVWLSRTDSDAVKVSKGFLKDLPDDLRAKYKLSWVTQQEDSLEEKKKKVRQVYPIIVDLDTGEPKVHFTSLNVQNKGVPFPDVKWLIFDEFLIEEGTSTRYLKNEINIFFDLLQTIARHKTDFKTFLIGNEIDVFNPYFAYFGIEAIDKTKQFAWIRKPDILLEWIPINPIWEESYNNSAFKRIVKGSAYDTYMLGKAALKNYDLAFKAVPQYASRRFNLFHNDNYLTVFELYGDFYITDRMIDKTYMSIVPNVVEAGIKKIYDAKIKSAMKEAIGKGIVFCENKRSRTLLLEWLRG